LRVTANVSIVSLAAFTPDAFSVTCSPED